VQLPEESTTWKFATSGTAAARSNRISPR
jgi:hypothetical protein